MAQDASARALPLQIVASVAIPAAAPAVVLVALAAVAAAGIVVAEAAHHLVSELVSRRSFLFSLNFAATLAAPLFPGLRAIWNSGQRP